MLVDVYRCRVRGEKQDPDAIRQDRHRGRLRYALRLHDPRPGRSVMVAQLVGADGETYVLPVLDRARVLAVKGDRLLITGVEVIALGRGIKNIKSMRYPQTWWCVLPPIPR